MTVRKNNRDKWMIDIKFEHLDGRKQRVRKTATVQSKRGAEAQERQIRQALIDGTYREDAEPEPEAMDVFAATLTTSGEGSEVSAPTPAKATGQSLTVEGYARTFMAARRLTLEKPSSLESKESHLREHLIPVFGERLVGDFEHADWGVLRKYLLDKQDARVKKKMAARKKKGLPALDENATPPNGISTFNNVASTLNSMIEDAGESGLVSKDCFRFKLLPRHDNLVDFYDFEQFEELVFSARKFSTLAEVIVLLGGEAGLRRSEMYPLLWAHCQLSLRQLKIYQAEVVVKFEADEAPTRALGTPKNGLGRVVRMTDRVVDALERHRQAQGRRGGRVVLRPDGTPFTDHPFRDLLIEVQMRAGLPATGNVHILRHTFCSHLAMMGTPLPSIQKLAGHKTLKTTMKYIHLIPDEVDKAVDRLNDRSNHLGRNWVPKGRRGERDGVEAAE